MRYLALAVDYDGTLATEGRVAPIALEALARVRLSGRRTILVTGRRLDDLRTVLPQLNAFDYVVAENGALLYEPQENRQVLLGEAPPAQFLPRLQELGVTPLEIGEVIVATHLPYQEQVLQAIQEGGLELQVIFNRSAVMVLPTGVNKAVGLDHALRSLGLSRHEAVGVGDAENDHSFLRHCECAVAVANAVPSVRSEATMTTTQEAGAGVAELAENLLANDLAGFDAVLQAQRRLVMGYREDGTPVTLAPYGTNVLIAGPSGSGKSTIAAGLVERLTADAYQVCVIDPEGDYGMLHEVVTIGSSSHAVDVSEVLSALADPLVSLNVNLLGIPLADRPAFFAQLLPTLEALRLRTARPHWAVLDEAHHMWPADSAYMSRISPSTLINTAMVTVHPGRLSMATLSVIDVVIAVGAAPERTLKAFADAAGLSSPSSAPCDGGTEYAVVWQPRSGEGPFSMRILPARTERMRHLRKYAEGNMRYNSFYFRGPAGRQNLRAQNLAVFSQISEGIDEETWLYHLRRGDYSRWIRDAVKDSYLAERIRCIEKREDLDTAETRRLIKTLIEQRYTLPE